MFEAIANRSAFTVFHF